MESNFDLSYIEEVACGDQAMVKELLSDIVVLIKETEIDLQQFLLLKDYSGIANAAHKLKAPIQMVGANLFYEKIQELEAAAKATKPLEEILPLYNIIVTLSINCRQSLENIEEME